VASGERQEDSARVGVGTMTRSGIRPRPGQAPEDAPAANPRRGRPARQVPRQRPTSGQQPEPGSPGQNIGAHVADRREQRTPPQSAPAQRPSGEQRAASALQRADTPQAAGPPARQGTRPRTGAPWRVPPAARVTGPVTGPQPTVPPGTGQPGTGQHSAGPHSAGLHGHRAEASPAGETAQQPRSRQQVVAAVAGSRRMPFVLLLCGLLGGALVSALVISTTLAEGSYQITKLQDSTSALAQQRQTLEEQVAQDQSDQVIEQRASQLGMRRPGELRFVNLLTGKVTDDGPTWSGAVNAPGYAP
jgi:cell division protein FtsB